MIGLNTAAILNPGLARHLPSCNSESGEIGSAQRSAGPSGPERTRKISSANVSPWPHPVLYDIPLTIYLFLRDFRTRSLVFLSTVVKRLTGYFYGQDKIWTADYGLRTELKRGLGMK